MDNQGVDWNKFFNKALDILGYYLIFIGWKEKNKKNKK